MASVASQPAAAGHEQHDEPGQRERGDEPDEVEHDLALPSR
jgi:hypothetical protein